MEPANLTYLNNLPEDEQRVQLELLKKFTENTTLYRQHAHCKIFYVGNPSLAVMSEMQYPVFCSSRGLEYAGYYPTEELNSEAIAFLQKSRESKDPINEYYARVKGYFLNLQSYFDELRSKDLDSLSLEEVKACLLDLDSRYFEMWNHAFLPDKFDPAGSTLLKSEIDESGAELNEEERHLLTAPHELNFVERSDLELLKIALSWNIKQKKDDEITKRIKDYCEQFYFVKCSWNQVTYLDEEQVTKQIEMMMQRSEGELRKQIDALGSLPTTRELEAEDLEEEKEFSDSLCNVFHLYRMLTQLRDERKENVLRSNYFLQLLLDRFVALHSLSEEEAHGLYWFFPREIVSKSIDELKEEAPLRQKGVIFVRYELEGDFHLILGDQVTELLRALKNNIASQHNELKGLGASKGVVRGEVCIVQGETHFSKFKEGQILVAGMTRPEYVPLMKKAAAIVTDEGGITSHAAVVSRELGVPCIIGTQVATEQLMDGMQVEVDAEKGIVKILDEE